MDEIQQRILNGDGGSWIKETYDPDAIFQRTQRARVPTRHKAFLRNYGKQKSANEHLTQTAQHPILNIYTKDDIICIYYTRR